MRDIIRTGTALLLGVGLVVASGFGLFFADLSFGGISHTQQGYSCQEPPQNHECADLANQVLFWHIVQAISVLAFVAGLVLPILMWVFENP